VKRENIRNFCIIAHIDHGKSTLADRLLEVTGTVDPRQMSAQFMDSMDLERERGITIKGKAVRMTYRHPGGQEYQFNLIDTPGHVDFTYEVSRGLAACEGALLVVDATQGVQAQTLANVYLAMERDLTIIPVINKIDAPAAEPDRVAQELEQVFGFKPEEALMVSAKEGTGVRELMEAIVQRMPPPKGEPSSLLRALIFDSSYNLYKGVVAYVRVVDGAIESGQRVRLMGNGVSTEVSEVGVFRPKFEAVPSLEAGEVGYIATGLKNVRDCRVGDTITLEPRPASQALAGYRPLKPLVFAGLYPADSDDFPKLREALERLQLNDAALSFIPEQSPALGPGFRCGFLGLLHMEIVQERLEREYGLDLVITAPSVSYIVKLGGSGESVEVGNPSDLPPISQIAEIQEPWLDVRLITPSRFAGPMMELVNQRRGEFKRTEYLEAVGHQQADGDSSSPSLDPRVLLEVRLPLSELLAEFYNQVKSRSQGYASLDYEFAEYRPGKLVRLDLLVNNQRVDALSMIVHKDQAYYRGKALVQRLREAIPRQLFEVPIQAASDNQIIARETIPALRKDVLAKLYGGDVTRKMKLLEKQRAGKKRMKMIGRIEIPQEAFLAVLKVEGR
jgi:GTP-binding protein LepA